MENSATSRGFGLRRIARLIPVVLVVATVSAGIMAVALTNDDPVGKDSDSPSLFERTRRTVTAAQVAVRDGRYSAHFSNGSGKPDSIHWVDRTGSSNLVIVAPHAVNHHRDGGPKRADLYTGAIAETLANRLNASVLTTTGEVSDWEEKWKGRDDEFTRVLHNLPDDAVIVDLHGMDSSSSNEPIAVGTSKEKSDSSTSMEMAEDIEDAFDGRAEINGRFAAESSYTVTRHMQERGHDAVQVEISQPFRAPRKLNVGYTVDALAEALQKQA